MFLHQELLCSWSIFECCRYRIIITHIRVTANLGFAVWVLLLNISCCIFLLLELLELLWCVLSCYWCTIFASFACTEIPSGVPTKSSLLGLNVTSPAAGVNCISTHFCLPSFIAGNSVASVGSPVSGSMNLAGLSSTNCNRSYWITFVNLGVFVLVLVFQLTHIFSCWSYWRNCWCVLSQLLVYHSHLSPCTEIPSGVLRSLC